MTLGTGDLPALHSAASQASEYGQRMYLLVMRADLIALVLGAMTGAVVRRDLNQVRLLNGAAALLFAASFGLTLVLLAKNYDRIWYGGRAVAESVKTLAWRYATCSEPFQGTPRDADEQFVKSLRSVMAEREALSIVTESVPLEGTQITSAMRALRQASMSERRDTYLRDRVEEQRRWYATRSGFNTGRERVLFGLVLLCQTVAGIYSVLLVVEPEMEVNLTGVFATAAASFLVWMQAKQFQELAQSYAIASQELGFALAQGAYVDSDATLSQFVSDTENAISREHTLWAARRDRLPLLNRV